MFGDSQGCPVSDILRKSGVAGHGIGGGEGRGGKLTKLKSRCQGVLGCESVDDVKFLFRHQVK